MEDSESYIIAAAKRDRRLFAPLYEKHFNAVFGFIRLRVTSPDDAADLTAQTFLKAMLNISNYEDRGLPFKAWLFRIAINEVNQHWRQMKKSGEIKVPAHFLEQVVEEVLPKMDANELLDLVVVEINKLPEDQLLLVEMKFFEKRSYAEMAAITGVSESALKMRVSRIVATLRKELGGRP